MRPRLLVLTYVSRDGQPWELDEVLIAGAKRAADDVRDAESSDTIASFYPSGDLFDDVAPEWVRELVYRHLVPAPMDQTRLT